MAGPQDFMVGNAPQGASYAAPLLNFDNLAKLPQTMAANQAAMMDLQARRAFPNGLPTLPDGSPDTQEILKKTVQFGGAPAAQALLPYLQKQQVLQGTG